MGEKGGEYEHFLTVEQIPSHNHSIFTTINETEHSANKDKYTYAGWLSSYGVGGTELSGRGHAHNNKPPYYATYIWHRTA